MNDLGPVSNGLGEWDDDTPLYDLSQVPVADHDDEPEEPQEFEEHEEPEEQATSVTGQVGAALAAVDVASTAGGLTAGGLLTATITNEIHRQVQHEIAPIVSEAIAALLTPAPLDTLREAASAAAEPPPAQTAETADAAEEASRLYYGSVDEFVREFICPTFRRNVGQEGRADYRWSARWWQSAEAITRLEAIWRAWEHLRMDPATGTSVWLRDHADHHLGILMSPTGPWALSQDTASPNEPLPYEPPPEGLFPDVRDN